MSIYYLYILDIISCTVCLIAQQSKSVWQFMDFWKRHGPQLRTVHFRECDLPRKEVYIALEHCPKLKSLNLGVCSENLRYCISNRIISLSVDIVN